jgi:hypothetical protein
MPQNDESLPIDAESIEQLDQVRKGKPRKFVLLCKGASIVGAAVYRKGTVEKFTKQLKKVGTGQIYFGVVAGRGMDLTFQLARSDGFDKEPVKTLVLKGFLQEHAQLKCKPLFVIVDVAPFVLDEDDPLVQRFLRLQEAALLACDRHPERTSEINTLCRQIGGYLDGDQAEQAVDKLESLERLLQTLGTAMPRDGSETLENKAEQNWLAAHAKLGNVIDELLQAGLGDTSKLRGAWDLALERAENDNFDGALKTVPTLVQLIKSARETDKSEAERAIPAGLVPYVRARHQWIETRMKLREEIGRLRQAIIDKLPSEHFGDVRAATQDLYDHISTLDDRLETTLETLVETPDGSERERLKTQAVGIVDQYTKALDSDFFRDVDDGNGFMTVAVRAPAVAALAEVSTALAFKA